MFINAVKPFEKRWLKHAEISKMCYKSFITGYHNNYYGFMCFLVDSVFCTGLLM